MIDLSFDMGTQLGFNSLVFFLVCFNSCVLH